MKRGRCEKKVFTMIFFVGISISVNLKISELIPIIKNNEK